VGILPGAVRDIGMVLRKDFYKLKILDQIQGATKNPSYFAQCESVVN
jgi:hypothetical protein